MIKNKLIKKVGWLLTRYPKSRDNDGILLSLVWCDQLQPYCDNYSCKDVFKMLANNKLVKPESVRRIRQKLQEECVELRGEVYLKRHKKADSFVEDNFSKFRWGK